MAKGFLSKKWNSDRREQKIEARLSQMKSQKDELISIADSFVSNHLFSYERASSKRPIIRDNDNDSERVRDKDFWCPKRVLIIPDTIKSFNALTWFWLTPIPHSFCMDQPRSYFRPPLPPYRFLLRSSMLVRTLTLANRMPKMRNTKDKVFYLNVTLQRGLDCGVCRLLVLATYCALGRSFVCRHLC